MSTVYPALTTMFTANILLWERGVCPRIIRLNRHIYEQVMHILRRQNQICIATNQGKTDYVRYHRIARIFYEHGNRAAKSLSATSFSSLLPLFRKNLAV